MIGYSRSRARCAATLFLVVLGTLLLLARTARADVPPVPLLNEAPSALTAASGSGGGGNGGNASSASSSTNTFSPAAYVNYNSLGGEPTTTLDRYPITSGTYNGQACTSSSPCYPDIVYVSNPLGVGFPGFSQFYKSSDGGTSFRIPQHDPAAPEEPLGTLANGGGDSHQAVGEVTHSVFFVDLSGGCVTMSISRDFGETFSSDKLGCGANPGVIDDRQWVATDETAPDGQDVYMNFNNDSGCLTTNEPGCSIVFVKSTDDGGANTPADFAASSCNAFAGTVQTGASDTTPTSCPDPADPNFYIAGPIVVDKSPSSPHQHTLYIPFERQVGQSDGTTNVILYIAKSTDEGNSWTRMPVANLGPHDAANIFPELTVDQGGNLYFTWSQARRLDTSGNPQNEGETDVYYAYSEDAGATWSAPIDLTKETGDSAVFPWMVAGSKGKVDLVYYKANSGLNPNIAFYDSSGNSCDPSSQTGCIPNTTQWNTYFAQSQNALNPGADFKSVQISPHPIHQGGVCTSGIACQSTAQQNRDLLDFFTVDVDHTGAAYVTWADDNDSQHDTRQFFSRQLAGASIFSGQNIAAKSSWPTTGHSATDPPGDVYDAAGLPDGSCPGMDVLGDSANRSGDSLTVTLTLNAPPSSTEAITCAKEAGATGGLWGAEFWAAAPIGPVPAATSEEGNTFGNGNFYIAYRDNPVDGGPGVEAGLMNSLSPSFTHVEFHKYEDGAPVGGTCFAAPPPSGPCTVVMTASLSGLGIKAGSILASLTGLSVYYFGSENQPPALRFPLGNSNLADAAAPFDINGTGTTTK